MSNKHLTIIFLLLISICGVSIFLYSKTEAVRLCDPSSPRRGEERCSPGGTYSSPVVSEHPLLPPPQRGRESVPTNTKTTISKTTTTSSPPPDPRIRPDDKQESTPVKMIVGDKTYETKMLSDSTVYDLMKKLSRTEGLQFSSREYPGLGQFMEEINGVKENKQQGIYWLLYVNGKSASIGISNYVIKPNDLISWKYDKAQF